MAISFMFSLFASIFFIFLFLTLLKFFKYKSRELPLPPGTVGWPYNGETFQLYCHNSTVFFASKLKGYGSIFLGQGQYHAILRKLVLLACVPKAIKSIVSNIKSIDKDSLPSMKGRLITSQEMKTPGLVAFPKSMKKDGILFMKVGPFALTLLLLLAKVAGSKPQTLDYGIIKNNNNAPPSTSTHPPPANDRTRSCNAENYCRHFTLSAENTSGTRVEAVAWVDVGAPLNSSAPGLGAIASGIAAWSLNNKKFGRLSVSMNATADPASAQMLQLAVSGGIDRIKGLDVEYGSASMSTEDIAALPPVDGNITITVGAASKQVDLKFVTRVDSFVESDVIWILEYAKAKILAGGQ